MTSIKDLEEAVEIKKDIETCKKACIVAFLVSVLSSGISLAALIVGIGAHLS